MKVSILIAAAILSSTSLFSQPVNERIDKQFKDPKMSENAGKADVYILKKIIHNAAAVGNNDSVVVSTTKEKRKKHCKRK